MSRKKQYLKIKESWAKIKSSDFDFHRISSYFCNNDNTKYFQVISKKTINDIDFHELFMFLDRTNSKIGQQYLYNKLLVIDLKYKFDEQEKLIEYYNNNEQCRIETQLLLTKLNKTEAYYISSLFQDEYIKKPKWFWVIPALSIVNLASLILAIFLPKFFLVLFFTLIISLLFHYWNKRNIFIYTESISQLVSMLEVTRKLLKKHSDNAVQNTLKSFEKLKMALSIFSMESKSNNSDFAVMIFAILEHIKIFFLIEPIFVFHVLENLDNKRTDLHKLFKYIGNIDSAISIASLRASLKYFCKPEFSNDSPVLSYENIYHPLIIDCVENSLIVNGKSILLTGSNMSGKTTFIRTNAINVLCAQTINTCFATKFVLKPMQLFSAIRITDDLMNDRSYYFEEVLTIKQIVNESESDSYKLFLLDEIFKGTNTIERIAAGKAVLSYIGKNKNIVFVSTHDIELTELLNDSYELYHFTETIENGSVNFDYKLKEGNLATRNAIKILEMNEYPSEITDEAKEISKNITNANGHGVYSRKV